MINVLWNFKMEHLKLKISGKTLQFIIIYVFVNMLTSDRLSRINFKMTIYFFIGPFVKNSIE